MGLKRGTSETRKAGPRMPARLQCSEREGVFWSLRLLPQSWESSANGITAVSIGGHVKALRPVA